jgi:hypothetical protein
MYPEPQPFFLQPYVPVRVDCSIGEIIVGKVQRNCRNALIIPEDFHAGVLNPWCYNQVIINNLNINKRQISWTE